jgi:hypothetical protein
MTDGSAGAEAWLSKESGQQLENLPVSETAAAGSVLQQAAAGLEQMKSSSQDEWSQYWPLAQSYLQQLPEALNGLATTLGANAESAPEEHHAAHKESAETVHQVIQSVLAQVQQESSELSAKIHGGAG